MNDTTTVTYNAAPGLIRARRVLAAILVGCLHALPLSAQVATTGGAGGVLLPSHILKENLDFTDPIQFLLDNQKPLALSSAQVDSVKRYHRELQVAQRPVFKQLDAVETPQDVVTPSEPVLALADKLLDLQDECRQRARAVLTRSQRAQADAIEVAWLVEQRKRLEAQER